MTKYICIGSPYYIGQRIDERTEVDALETSGIAAEIGATWINIKPDFDSAPDALTAINLEIARIIYTHTDCVPIIFASDCIASLGVLKGLEAHNPALIWYDAHGDFNTEETTPSNFLGGMPLAWLVGDGDQKYMTGADVKPLAQTDVIMTDGRDLDPEEAIRVENSEITHIKRIEKLLRAPLPEKPLWIHCDTDVVDIDDLPGMNYPAPDGPSLEMTCMTIKRVANDANCIGLSLSLWNDSLPNGGKALAGTLKLVRAFVEGNK